MRVASPVSGLASVSDDSVVQVEESLGRPPQVVFGIHPESLVGSSPISVVVGLDHGLEVLPGRTPLYSQLPEERLLTRRRGTLELLHAALRESRQG